MKTGYYVITPWTKKYIGELPMRVKELGRRLPGDIYMLKQCCFMRDPQFISKTCLIDEFRAKNGLS